MEGHRFQFESGEPQGDLPAERFPLAYVILAHDNFGTLEELIGRLSASEADTVVVHLDRRVRRSSLNLLRARFADRPNVHIISVRRCRWGGISLVEATIAGLTTLRQTKRAYEYVSLLSGIDFPIKRSRDLRWFLAASGRSEFIEAYDFYLERWIITGIYAERFEYWFPFARSGFLSKPFKIWYHLVQLLDIRRPPPPGVVPYSGSQWWTLTREAVHWLLDSELSRTLLRRLRSSFVPDETYFSTLVMASPMSGNVASRNLRYVKWKRSGTPKTLDGRDAVGLARSEAFFARKIVKRHDRKLFELVKNDLLPRSIPSRFSTRRRQIGEYAVEDQRQ